MIPIIVSTYPENGSRDMVLNSPIKIRFADAIFSATVNEENITLENLHDHREIPLTFEYDSSSFELEITPEDNGYNGNFLLGLVDYKLSISNIKSEQAETMQGLWTLEFTTVADAIEDVVPVPEPAIDELIVTNIYPKQGSYGVTPANVKIKFNHNILESTVNSSTFILTDDAIIDVNDIGFVDTTAVAGTYQVAGNIITFTPEEELDDNKKYFIILTGIKDEGDQLTIEPAIYTFCTAFTPLYTTLEDLQTTSISLFIKGLNPEEVLSLIQENSELAHWIAEQFENQDNIVWSPPERIVVEYVKAKTRYDIVFDQYIQLSGQATSKTLGDLQIEYGMSLRDLLALADKLKLAYEYWENMLKGSTSGKVTPRIFKKGENVDEDPSYKNRALKDWGGTKTW